MPQGFSFLSAVCVSVQSSDVGRVLSVRTSLFISRTLVSFSAVSGRTIIDRDRADAVHVTMTAH